MSAHRSRIQKLTESAVFVALAFVLSYIQIKFLPYGGAVTCFSMLPILFIGYRSGFLFGLGSSLVYAVLQLFQNHALVPPADGLSTYLLMLLLDYFMAFGVLSLSAFFRKKKLGLFYAALVCTSLRYGCHIVSGILLWGSYAWDGWAVFPYSVAYNGTYMIPEIILTALSAFLIVRYLPERYLQPSKS